MKKVFILAILVCLVSTGLFALDLSVGAKVGGSAVLGASENDPPDLDDSEGLQGGLFGFGFTGGVAVELGFTPLFSVEADILYAGMFKYGYYSLAGGKSETTLSTLEIPVLAKATFGGFFVDAGPSLIIPVSKLKNDHPLGGHSETDVDMAFGVSGGVGYGFEAGKGELSVELRYTRTLTPLNDVLPTGKSYFNRVDLLAGYSFDL